MLRCNNAKIFLKVYNNYVLLNELNFCLICGFSTYLLFLLLLCASFFSLQSSLVLVFSN
jgi:hypothetical protein